jgi:hypothetical protein
MRRASSVRVMKSPRPTPPDRARNPENSLSTVSCMVAPPKPSVCSDSSSSDFRICCTICSISIASNCCDSSATLARSAAGVGASDSERDALSAKACMAGVSVGRRLAMACLR